MLKTKENPLTLPTTGPDGLAESENPLLTGIPAPTARGKNFAQTEARVEAGLAKNWSATISEARYKRAAKRRKLKNGLRVARAREMIQELPAAGESLHAVIKGNFNFWDCVPAVMQLHGGTVDHLILATLSFNRNNAEAILEQLDTGQIKTVQLVASVFFEAHEPELCIWLANELEKRGSTLRAVRVHAKVIGMAFTNGDTFTMEGSANLRSCRMVEQFMIANDPDLLAFHVNWIGELCADQ